MDFQFCMHHSFSLSKMLDVANFLCETYGLYLAFNLKTECWFSFACVNYDLSSKRLFRHFMSDD